jgi:hypothetical protein
MDVLAGVADRLLPGLDDRHGKEVDLRDSRFDFGEIEVLERGRLGDPFGSLVGDHAGTGFSARERRFALHERLDVPFFAEHRTHLLGAERPREQHAVGVKHQFRIAPRGPNGCARRFGRV